jgi:hypothetical protein
VREREREREREKKRNNEKQLIRDSIRQRSVIIFRVDRNVSKIEREREIQNHF